MCLYNFYEDTPINVVAHRIITEQRQSSIHNTIHTVSNPGRKTIGMCLEIFFAVLCVLNRLLTSFMYQQCPWEREKSRPHRSQTTIPFRTQKCTHENPSSSGCLNNYTIIVQRKTVITEQLHCMKSAGLTHWFLVLMSTELWLSRKIGNAKQDNSEKDY